MDDITPIDARRVRDALTTFSEPNLVDVHEVPDGGGTA
jgi:hypothetical protein